MPTYLFLQLFQAVCLFVPNLAGGICVSGIQSWMGSYSCCFCLRKPLSSLGMGGFEVWVELVDYRVQWQVLVQLAYMKRSHWLSRGPGAWPWGLGPKDWAIQPWGCSLTSCLFFYAVTCIKNETIEVVSKGWVWGQGGTCVLRDSIQRCWRNLFAGRLPAGRWGRISGVALSPSV